MSEASPPPSIAALARELREAAQSGDAAGIRALVERWGPRPFSVDPRASAWRRLRALPSWLSAHAEAAHLLKGACRDMGDPIKRREPTPLMTAAYHGQAECLAALLPFSDPNQKREDGADALILCGLAEDPSPDLEGVARCMETLAPMADQASRDQAFRHALSWGMESGIEALWDLADPRAADRNGCTALMAAAQNCGLDALLRLIPVSDLDARNSLNGCSAWMMAVAVGSGECAGLLVEASGEGVAGLLAQMEGVDWWAEPFLQPWLDAGDPAALMALEAAQLTDARALGAELAAAAQSPESSAGALRELRL